MVETCRKVRLLATGGDKIGGDKPELGENIHYVCEPLRVGGVDDRSGISYFAQLVSLPDVFGKRCCVRVGKVHSASIRAHDTRHPSRMFLPRRCGSLLPPDLRRDGTVYLAQSRCCGAEEGGEIIKTTDRVGGTGREPLKRVGERA